MWDFAFSIYGAAGVLVLLAISLFTVWVFGANIRHNYSGTLTGIKKSGVEQAGIRFPPPSKTVLASSKKAQYYWKRDVSKKGSQFSLPLNAFLSDSVYHLANSVHLFALHKELLGKNRLWVFNLDFALKFVLFFLAANIIWSLLLGAWIIAGAVAFVFLCVLVADLLITQKTANQVCAAVQADVLSQVPEEHAAAVRKYCRWLRYYFIKKYAMCFLEPYVELVLILWALGREE